MEHMLQHGGLGGDENDTGSPTAAAFLWPILPGRVEAWRRFLQEMLGTRRLEVGEMYRRLGITRALVWLASLPQGEAAVVYLEAMQPERVIRDLGKSSLPVDRWYKQCIYKLHGLDLEEVPPGELMYVWQQPFFEATSTRRNHMSTEENKIIVRRYREIHNNNKLDELDAIVAADIISHSSLPGLPPGLAGGKMAHMGAMKAFEGLHTDTNDLVAEGDKVVEYFTTTGKHTGDFLGIPPTGRPINVQGMSIFRLAGGKIVEHWGVNDGFALLVQLGVVPMPG